MLILIHLAKIEAVPGPPAVRAERVTYHSGYVSRLLWGRKSRVPVEVSSHIPFTLQASVSLISLSNERKARADTVVQPDGMLRYADAMLRYAIVCRCYAMLRYAM